MKPLSILFFLAMALLIKAFPVLSACGDIFPPGSPGLMDCGDGSVNIFDADEAARIIGNNLTPTACQLINGDVPNGIPEYCGTPPGTSNCGVNGVFDILDYLVIADKALNKINCCDHCFLDADRDGSMNELDNCTSTPNGPFRGTCTRTITGVVTHDGWLACDTAAACAPNESCQMDQEDGNSNGIGDVCECYGDFNSDSDCDGSDAALFKKSFGRSQLYHPCPAAR